MPHTHWPGGVGPSCRFRTKRECDEAYADWQAAQQVMLAARVVEQGHAKAHSKGSTVFDQLVQVMAGERATIVNDDGTPTKAPFTRRILTALEDYKREMDAVRQR